MQPPPAPWVSFPALDCVQEELVRVVKAQQRNSEVGHAYWRSWVAHFGIVRDAEKGYREADPSKYDAEQLLGFLCWFNDERDSEARREQIRDLVKNKSVDVLRNLCLEIPTRLQRGQKREREDSGEESGEVAIGSKRTRPSQEEATAAGSTSGEQNPPELPRATLEFSQSSPDPEHEARKAAVLRKAASQDFQAKLMQEVPDGFAEIPKILHMSASAPWEELDPEILAHVALLMEKLPGWELRYYDDNRMRDIIVANCTAREKAAFFRINPRYGPARADFLRYVLMRTVGGCWLDMKSGWKHPEALEKYFPLPPLVLCNWDNANRKGECGRYDVYKRGEIQNWNLMSAPGHPLWYILMNQVVENIEKMNGKGKEVVLNITGPLAMSKVFYPLLPRYRHLLVKQREAGFVYDVVGNHEQKQGSMGMGEHYTKLKELVILPGAVSQTTGQPMRGSAGYYSTIPPFIH